MEEDNVKDLRLFFFWWMLLQDKVVLELWELEGRFVVGMIINKGFYL